jgi:hypothetical protein
MTDVPDPLTPQVLRALELERARPPVGDEQLARLAARIEGSFAAAAPAVATSAASTGAAAKAVGSVAATKAVLVAVSLGVGAVMGAQVQARFGTPREVIIERRIEVPAPVKEEPAPAAPVKEEPAPPIAPPRLAERAAPKKAEHPPVELERLLIEQATAALSRGNAEQTLEACTQHAAQFPNGQLSEERESLAIRALLHLGRREEARARAAEFRARYPDGLLLDVVEKALEEAGH